ncbi:ribosomal l9 RNAse h1 protein [Rutstroemia sp. NJR-2017a BVV2]|nr:ribosomal l9 RNAse h1 protein [Rutstroemia sp. NJR-2017a BVV2]
MASLLQHRAPSCLSCLRRTTAGLTDGSLFPSGQQIRGKKQLAKEKDHTVTVKLLSRMPGYGAKGRMVQVPPGLMRNKWYPRRQAVYVTPAELEVMGSRKIVAPPDGSYGSRTVAVQAPVGLSSEPKEVKKLRKERAPTRGDILSPEQSSELLSRLLPPNLEFSRTAITIAPPPVKRISPSIPASSVISAAAGGNEKRTPEKVAIYGSVSTTDIAANLKAIMAEDEQGKRVVFGPEDITFVGKTEEKDQVKHVGTFEIDIKVKGASDAVRRTIRVNAQG